jgi:N-sulfoglucosamine sulfohydrolase
MKLNLVLSLSLVFCLISCKPANPPNFLFAIADDASYPHMSAYGCDWVKTPAFDKVAKDGILFTNCYTPNAKCAPSRACILTGRNSWQLEEAANHWPYFPAKFKTFAEVLNENGYHVGYTLKGYAPGIALNDDGSPRDLLVKKFNEATLTPPTNAIAKIDYAGNFDLFLKDRKEDQPFFFWYGSIEPHRAYEFNSGSRITGRKLSDIDQVPGFWPDTDTVRTDMLDYSFEIEYFDRHLQKMLNKLQEIGEAENTFVIVTADNGMPFPRVKGQAYEYSNHLPLAICWPKGIKKSGQTVAKYVSFIDFAPTILELAQIEQENSGMFPITGKSLTDIFFKQKSKISDTQREYVLIGKERHDVGRPNDEGFPIRGIVMNGMLYVRNFKPDRWPAGDPISGYLNTDGSPTKSQILCWNRQNKETELWQLSFGKRSDEELYNINSDRECLFNLADNPEYSHTKKALSETLTEKLIEQNDPRIFGEGDIFDQYPYADKKTQHFYERYQNGENINAGWVSKTDFEKTNNK